MSITGFDLRKRLRRGAVRVLDALLERLEHDEATVADAPPPSEPAAVHAAAPVPKAAPAPATKAPPLAPLPDLKPRTAPLGAQRPSDTVATEPPARAETDAGRKAKASPEDRQKQHWERTRKGILRFVADQGGTAALRELHDHSERTYFVAHVGFSRLMEELTAGGLLDYDHDTAVATLTDAGKAAADA